MRSDIFLFSVSIMVMIFLCESYSYNEFILSEIFWNTDDLMFKTIFTDLGPFTRLVLYFKDVLKNAKSE